MSEKVPKRTGSTRSATNWQLHQWEDADTILRLHLAFLPRYWSSILITGTFKKESFMKLGFWKEPEILMRNTPNQTWGVWYRKLFHHFCCDFLKIVLYIPHFTAVRWTQFWPEKSSCKIILQDKGPISLELQEYTLALKTSVLTPSPWFFVETFQTEGPGSAFHLAVVPRHKGEGHETLSNPGQVMHRWCTRWFLVTSKRRTYPHQQPKD